MKRNEVNLGLSGPLRPVSPCARPPFDEERLSMPASEIVKSVGYRVRYGGVSRRGDRYEGGCVRARRADVHVVAQGRPRSGGAPRAVPRAPAQPGSGAQRGANG